MTLITFAPFTKIKSADINTNFSGLADGSNDLPANSLLVTRRSAFFNYVSSGLTLNTSANLTINLLQGVAFVNGQYLSIQTQPITVSANQDTYVDIKDTGAITLVPVANNATTGMALTLNSDGSSAFRIGKLVSGASAITSFVQSGLDPIGNAIFNQTPTERGVIIKGTVQGARFSTTSNTFVDVTGTPFQYRSGSQPEKLQITASFMAIANTNNGEIGLAINGASLPLQAYLDPGTPWYRGTIDYDYDLPANTQISISLQAFSAGTGGSTNVANDQLKWVPQFRVIAKRRAT